MLKGHVIRKVFSNDVAFHLIKKMWKETLSLLLFGVIE